jgi:hypothetical protein
MSKKCHCTNTRMWFMKFGAVKDMLYKRGWIKFCPITFSVRFWENSAQKWEFRENRLTGNHTLIRCKCIHIHTFHIYCVTWVKLVRDLHMTLPQRCKFRQTRRKGGRTVSMGVNKIAFVCEPYGCVIFWKRKRLDAQVYSVMENTAWNLVAILYGE